VEQYLLLGALNLPNTQFIATVPDKYVSAIGSASREKEDKPPNSVRNQLREIERSTIIDALNRAGGNKKQAASDLGMSYRNLFNKIKQHKISFETTVK
jgi:DNA-binding NtrC family response regulator